MTDNGRERTGVDVLSWVAEGERLGAGELLVTSIDREGSATGMDLELLSAIRSCVRIPVIASGGAGSPANVERVFAEGSAEAVACAHILHYGLSDVASIKDHPRTRGVTVRLSPAPAPIGRRRTAV